ncbi:hypothetical protein [Exiguobacterium undae]|uniref:hypothetical protein n=1 Tax=Exiguobacterium undae TaxID=169177 RepID=UPI00047A7FA5|nr:hypothetical protein [Exiguobacterium undae]
MRGLEIFKKFFKDFKDHYVLIGGAACDVIFSEEGESSFRATKDLDLVLIVEALTPEFGKHFWSFIETGQYEHKAKSTLEGPQFYRFDKPKNEIFPYMIELFSRNNFELSNGESHLTPLRIDDEVSSLSAILLDEDYYKMLVEGRKSVGDIMILSELYLIPFKAKAWLDLTERKEMGLSVSSRDIKKHKNDVTRLASLLDDSKPCHLSTEVQKDMKRFMDAYRKDPVDPKALDLHITSDDIIGVLDTVYGTGNGQIGMDT